MRTAAKPRNCGHQALQVSAEMESLQCQQKKKKETSIRERQTLACAAENKQNAVISSTQDKIVGKRRKET